MKQLLEEIKSFIEERDWDQFHTPKNLAMGVSIEANELLEHFHWLTPEQSTALEHEKIEEVGDEMADVLVYLLALSDKLGIDIVDATRKKMIKNGAKYPADLCRGSAAKYTTYKT